MSAAPTVTRVLGERHGEVPVEVTWIRAADGVELALSRVGAPGAETTGGGVPVILVHGTYSRRNFWVSPKGLGLAPYLAERGFDPWVVELRGHGLSPKGDRYSSFTAEDHVHRDLPAVQAHVRAATDVPAFWGAHSAGGVWIAMALSAGDLDAGAMRGVVTLGSQLFEGEDFLQRPGVPTFGKALLRLMGHFPAPRLGLGPEIEPAGEMIDFIRWKGRGGRWVSRDGFSYADGMPGIRVPWLAFAGSADTNDPPSGCRSFLEAMGSEDSTFIELGRAHGFEMDYEHIPLVVSKEAAREVWPRIAAWMEERV